MYMYVPKNANNTSQNSQCVCVWVWLWYLQMIFASTPANAHGFAREFGKYYLHQGFGMQCYFQMT